MPTILHKVLSGNELHEPKGIDSANKGQVYVADGTGSGNWVYLPEGWAMYQDNAGEQTFNTTPSKLSINGLGSKSNSSYLPRAIRGSGEFWDTVNDKITPIAAGDAYDLRLVLPVTSRTTAKFLTLQLDIGGAGTVTNNIYESRLHFDEAAPFTLSCTFVAASLNTFLANGGQIFLSTEAGSIGITNPQIMIERTFAEVT